MIDNIGSLASSSLLQPKETGTIRSTAQQFEALLIGELLKTSREAGSSGWLGTGDEDEAGQLGVEVGEQEFARMLASSGGLGMTKLIEAGMRRDASAQPK